MTLDFEDHPHRRHNPLTGEWVLVSPHRAKRPWAGRAEAEAMDALPSYAPDCPLCPGNVRANGVKNPRYEAPFWFPNDFAAMLPDTPGWEESDALFAMRSVQGEARVLCFSPDHAKTLPELSQAAVARVIDAWIEAVIELSQDYAWVQIFENKGEIMGCSQPHPHSQVWASSFLPNEIVVRDANLKRYHQEQGSNLLLDYVRAELERGERVVQETQHWVALVPFWAQWPFETMLLPREHTPSFIDVSADRRSDLAQAIKSLTTRYDNLFRCSFPYSMGWHFSPTQEASEHWQLHALFYPPLLRSASVRKYMVGYEMLAESQRDLTAEQAAARLRELSEVHYKDELE